MLTATGLRGQVTLLLETFETDGEGTRYTSNTFTNCGDSDFFLRTNTNPVSPASCGILYSSILTNLQGSFFWAAEDVIGGGGTCLGCRPAARLTFNSLNVAGYTGLTVSVYLATSGNNGSRWESADSLNLQVSFNGGTSYSTVGRFMGKGTPTVGNRLGIDGNLNGLYDVGIDPAANCDTVAFTKYTFNIPQTGSNMLFRLDLDQQGGSEELAFDHIEIKGFAPTCTPPTITCPGTQSLALNAFCQATLADYTSLATVTGNCSPTVTQSPAAGTTVSGSGAMTVSLFATNTALQSATCTFTVNKTTPEVEVRGNSLVIADGDATPSSNDHTDFGSVLSCTGTIVRTYTINNLSGSFARILNVGAVTVGGTNGSDFTVTSQPASTVSVGGSTTFTVTFDPSANGLRSATLSFTTDDCDENPYNFSIQGTGNADLVDPTVICPATQTLTLNSSCQATLPNYVTLATITDNCPGSPTTGQSPAAGTTQTGAGALTVSIFATDGSLNANTCTFTVNKVDNTAPNITCPGTITQAAGSGTCAATVTYTTPSGTDNCAGVTTTLTAGQASGSSFPVGTTTNTFRATDASGNSTTCSFNVVITDGQPPAITCPGNITQAAATGTCSATVTFTAPTGTDNCSGATTTQTAGQPSGTSFPVGVTTNTFRVTDASSNSTVCSFTVTVTDNQAPSLTCPSNSTAPQNSGTCIGPINFTMPTASDNCSGATVTQTFGPPNGSTASVGGNSIILQATDASGNTSTCSFIIDILDTELPSITCPPNQTAFTSPTSCDTIVNYPAPVATDNCSIAQITLMTGNPSGGQFFIGPTTVTLVAGDLSSNVSSCAFVVTVIDNVPPTALCNNITAYLDANGQAGIAAAQLDGGSTDNCGTIQGTISANSFTCSDIGSNTVTLTVSDTSGNSSTCQSTVTVADTMAPTALCANITLYLDNTGTATIIPPDIDGGSSDNCGSPNLAASQISFTTSDIGTNNVTLTATDPFGNASSCIAVVTVLDTITAVIDRIIPGISLEAAPNPFHDVLVLRVTCDGCEVGGLLTIELWNLTGQRLFQQTLPADLGLSTLRLPTGQLAAGTYLVSLTDGKGFISRRVVKQ